MFLEEQIEDQRDTSTLRWAKPSSAGSSVTEAISFIETIERTDRVIEEPDGAAFEMSETFEGGGQGTFWLVVSYDDMGALMITELAEAPQG